MEVYRIEIPLNGISTETTVGPWLAELYIKTEEISKVTWQWKKSLDYRLIDEEPEIPIGTKYVCGVTCPLKMLGWTGSRFVFADLLKIGFKLMAYECDESDILSFPEFDQCLIKSYKTKKEIDISYLRKKIRTN